MMGVRLYKSELVHLLAMAAAAALFCAPLFSQGSAGRILGSVTDQSGAVVSGATVTVLDVNRGIARTLTTDQSGEYVAPSLLPGKYSVRAEFKGFKAVDRQNIALEVNQDVRVDLSLQPGDQTQTITVTEELPLIETTNASLGGTLSNETINDLPLNGRSYQNLLVLRPGMMIYPGGGGWTMSTNGSRPEENQFILDGLTNDNPLQGLTIINGPGVAGDAATLMPIDAIQEVKIEESPKAEYGGKPGAVVNVGIKSGTNSIHGTAYAFGRDTSFDAHNFFDAPGQPKRPVGLEQYGATVGGPIKKDKLFFFLGYEAESYTVGNRFSANVPEDVSQVPGTGSPDTANSLVDALHALVNTPGASVSPLSLTLAGCPAPLPAAGSPSWTDGTYKCTGGLYPANTGSSPTITQGFPSAFRSDNGVLKIDYQINDHNSVNGMYFQSGGTITAEDVVYLEPQWLSLQYNRPRVLGATWTYTPNSRWVNAARFGFVRMNRMSQQVDSNVPPSTYGIFTGVTATGSLPIIRLSGFNALGGSPGWPYKFGPDTVFQAVDEASYVHGSHAFKFGADFRRNLADPSQFGAAKGAINFRGGPAALENFLSGTPTFATIQSGDPARQLSQSSIAGFFQDDWRVTQRLTLNLGLRYDYTTPMAEKNNLLGGFDPNLGMVQVGQQIKSLYNGDHKDFGPRFGLAWDISGKGTTVIRAGAGVIFNSLLPMQTFTGVAGNAVNVTGGVATVPTGATLVVNGVSTPGTGTIAVANVTIPGGGGSPLSSNWLNNSQSVPIFSSANAVECGDGSNDTQGNPTSPCALAVMDHNFRSPYVTTWTLGVQHAITNNLSVDVAYVGNHGSRLSGIRDINQPPAGAAYCLNAPLTPLQISDLNGCADPANPGSNAAQDAMPFNAKFPYLGPILVLSNLYRSNYHGLQATVQQRTAHGLSFLASYTFSHSLDNDSYNIGQFLPQDSTNPQAEYASSDFDIKHRFTFSLTYAIPGKKSPGQLLQGWELNSVVTVQTGQPWYGNDQSNNISGTNENTDRWDFVGNPGDFRSGNSSIPYCIGNGNVPTDFSNPSTIACTQTTPAGSVNLSNAFNTAAANACFGAANAINAATVASLDSFGCYFQGRSVLIPPALGTFGTSGRNIWRDPGIRNLDLSVTKSFKFQERLTAQFRAEFFNVLNHPNFTNPYGASSGFGIGAEGDPSQTSIFGCGCATPDQAAGNPVLGSGGNRAMQLGLKLIF